jgi:hypothetical protein
MIEQHIRIGQVNCAHAAAAAASRQAGRQASGQPKQSPSPQHGSRSYSRIVRLENRLRSAIVVADGLRLPAPVIPARIALVQLEAKVLIPTCEQEAHTERPLSCEGYGWSDTANRRAARRWATEAALTTVLRVALLGVTHCHQQVFEGHCLVVLEQVALRC